MQNGSTALKTILENSLTVYYEVKHTLAIGSSHSNLGIYPTKMKVYVHKKTQTLLVT